jgi:hypothetical protein
LSRLATHQNEGSDWPSASPAARFVADSDGNLYEVWNLDAASSQAWRVQPGWYLQRLDTSESHGPFGDRAAAVARMRPKAAEAAADRAP